MYVEKNNKGSKQNQKENVTYPKAYIVFRSVFVYL